MTIFALASAPGRAAVAVVRISGPAVCPALRALTGREPPPPRRAVVRRLADPATGRLLDQALVLRFAAPASYSGEDMAELHVHGGRATVAGVLDALARLPGLRPAEAGEFTRRAVAHGRLDLTAAEGVADLVAADTARQREQALAQMSGALARLYDGWRQRLLALMARQEAAIDFSDEDVPEDVLAGFADEVAALAGELGAHLADRRGERLRDGLAVAIVGAPNVGKSSLLNRLAGREAAIVSTEAGTTRDVVEVGLEVAGFAVVLADTAGLRRAPRGVEREGVARARHRAGEADLRLLLADASRWRETWPPIAPLAGERALVVANKADLAPPPRGAAALAISCASGAGLDALLAAMGQRFTALWRGAAPSPTRARHRACLQQAAAALDEARSAGEDALAAEALRQAAAALGRLTGRVDVEDVLDVVFAEFCIGK